MVERVRISPVGSAPRLVNMTVGALLFLSAFLLPQSPATKLNAIATGLASVGIASAALLYPVLRYANTVLSIWLFLSTIVLSHVSAASVSTTFFLSVTMFIVSLLPTKLPPVPQKPVPPSSYVSGPGGDYTA